MSEPVGDATIDLLRDVLGRSSRRAAVVASNLVNVDTPGYRAIDVRFEEELAAAPLMREIRTHPNHLPIRNDSPIEGKIVEARATRARNDGNTVDIDREMTKLAAIQGRYSAAAEMVRKRFALLIYAATDGRS
jgi:flagellar basal-body rod protein FlgB